MSDGKRIVICCDGTGNEIEEHQSNVLKFYRLLKKDDPSQITFYDPGVGTINNSGPWRVFVNKFLRIVGLAFGNGLDKNILDAYKFLITTYQEGDEIYLFGFSRGAYTIRALAGLLHLVGLLRPSQLHMAEYALLSFKQSKKKNKFEIGRRVHMVLAARKCPIKFVGCWDTVGSVIIPRSDRFYLPSLQKLPFIDKNSSVEVFRQAMAIDERRRMFRLVVWKKNQKFISPQKENLQYEKDQDCEQLWFAGVHSDIGGSYPEIDSSIAKYPLGWMVEEAQQYGLEFDKDYIDLLVYGKKNGMEKENAMFDYKAPSLDAKLNDSMTKGWKILEYIPKLKRFHDNPAEKRKGGIYFPLSERRHIAESEKFHHSVGDRIKKNKQGYKPENLPKSFLVELENNIDDA